ncbi:MAG: SPOCS domain-containing protein [Clostridium sp.]
MANKFRDCIQCVIPEKSKYFKEEAICEILTISAQKPDIERILDVVVWPSIENIKLVETEVGISVEGQRLSGYKVIVELRIKEKVTYVASEVTQSVHAAHFESLKSVFVVIPKEIDGKPTCNLIKAGKLNVTPYVEAVQTRLLDCRKIHKCVMIFVDVMGC